MCPTQLYRICSWIWTIMAVWVLLLLGGGAAPLLLGAPMMFVAGMQNGLQPATPSLAQVTPPTPVGSVPSSAQADAASSSAAGGHSQLQKSLPSDAGQLTATPL